MAVFTGERVTSRRVFEEKVAGPEVAAHFSVLDLTDDPPLLNASRRMVASFYKTLSTQEFSEEDVYRDLCQDGYDNHGRSRTIGVMTEFSGEQKVVGTVRLVLGSDEQEEGLYPLDAMGLVNANWPHRNMGIPDSQAGELGRFVIGSDYREDQVKKEITRMLFNESLRVGKERGEIQMLYAIMPSYVVKLVNDSGIGLVEVEDSKLRWDEPSARSIFETYDVYWSKLNPKLFQFLTE